ncbi:MAG: hypothetical protein JWR73_1381 [Tardiphaga sp.]|nr:hypothetical protein [Tardiphaga sp.]MDB5630636.1 hypothetical protein [Tardiphaga sp.]
MTETTASTTGRFERPSERTGGDREQIRAESKHPLATRIAIVLACLLVILIAGYFSFTTWGIRHQSLDFTDTVRNRVIDVDVAVRWDTEMKARAGMTKMPVAILSHGNTVKYTEYSFISNLMALRGYLVVCIQHDLPTDKELVTQAGSLFVGRLQVYERGEKNILYTIEQLKKLYPYADYDNLTMIGHSNGGDISMFFAQQHPGEVAKVVTLDNLRVPFLTGGGPKILSFRSKDWKPDPGVVPTDAEAKKAGIDIVHTDAQHTQMSDRGPESVKESIQSTLDKFLSDDSTSALSPFKRKDLTTDIRAMGP